MNNSVSHGLSEEYLEFERRFINNFDILVRKMSLSLPKRKEKEASKDWMSNSKFKLNQTESQKNSILELWRLFLPWYLRWILGSAPIAIFVVAFTLLGVEIYYSGGHIINSHDGEDVYVEHINERKSG